MSYSSCKRLRQEHGWKQPDGARCPSFVPGASHCISRVASGPNNIPRYLARPLIGKFENDGGNRLETGHNKGLHLRG
eukprot:3564182-Pyramimonas_sp.AAC.1